MYNPNYRYAVSYNVSAINSERQPCFNITKVNNYNNYECIIHSFIYLKPYK